MKLEIGEVTLLAQVLLDPGSLGRAEAAIRNMPPVRIPVTVDAAQSGGLNRLSVTLTELNDRLSGFVGTQRIVVQEVTRVDAATTTLARGVGILDSQVKTARIGMESYGAQSRIIGASLRAAAAEAAPLSREMAITEAALARLQATTNRMNSSALVERFKLEGAAIRQTKEELNSYRISWQANEKTDAEAAAYMARKETAIRGTIAALSAERTALVELGVPEAAQLTRIQQLTTEINGMSIALRTAVSVQAAANGNIMRGSLAAGVAAGMGTAATATRSLTAETERLTAAEKIGLITKQQLSTALLAESTAHRTALVAIEAETLALRNLGVLDVQQTGRLATLILEQDRYTQALLRSTTAQRGAAGMGAMGGVARGAGMGNMNGAGMALSFISPEAGMVAMAASMGPVIAGAAVVGLSLKKISDLSKEGVVEAKKLEQAFLVMGANGIKDLGRIESALNNIVKNGSDAEKMFSKAELAGALAMLARGGVKGEDAIKTLAVSTKLAAAEHIKLSEATERLYGNLQHLGMTADEASGFGDKLARASHMSLATMDNLSKGLNVVGATAHSMDFSLEESLAMMVRLAQKGMDPATIGATGLRNAMQKVLTPSETALGIYQQLGVALRDSTGHMRSGRDIMQDLQKTFSSTGPIYNQMTGEIITRNDLARMSFQIFGTRSATAFLSTIGNLQHLTDEVKDSSGFLNTYSGEVVSGLEGAQKRLDSATKNLSLVFAKTFTPALAGAVEWGTKVINTVNDVATAMDTGKASTEKFALMKLKTEDSDLVLFLKTVYNWLTKIDQKKDGVSQWFTELGKSTSLNNVGNGLASMMPALGSPEQNKMLDQRKQLIADLGVSTAAIGGIEGVLEKARAEHDARKIVAGEQRLAQLQEERRVIKEMLADNLQFDKFVAPKGAAGQKPPSVNTDAAGKFDLQFIEGLVTTGKVSGNPKIAAWCADVASKIQDELGNKLKYSASAGQLKKNALAAGYTEVDPKDAQSGDMVFYRNPQKYGAVLNQKTGQRTGNHVETVAGKDGDKVMLVGANDSTAASIKQFYDAAHATILRAPTSPFASSSAAHDGPVPVVANSRPNLSAGNNTALADGQKLYDALLKAKAGYAAAVAEGNTKVATEDKALMATLNGQVRAFKKSHADEWKAISDTSTAAAKAEKDAAKEAGISMPAWLGQRSEAMRLARLESQIGDGTLSESATIAAQKQIAAYRKAQEAALNFAQSRVAAEKSAADTTKQLGDRTEAESKRVRDALASNDVKAAQDALASLKTSQAAALLSTDDNAKKRLAVIKASSQQIFDAEELIARKQRAASLQDAKGEKDPGVRTGLIKQANDAHKLSVAQAAQDRRAAMRTAADQMQQDQDKADKDSASKAKEHEQTLSQIATAARQGNVALAQQGLDRLKALRDADLAAAGDSATKQLAVQKKYADDLYNGALKVAAAQKVISDAAANNGPAQNRAQGLKVSQGEFDAAKVAAEAVRAETLKKAQQVVKEAVDKTRESYLKLTQSVQKQLETGQFDNDARHDALKSFNELTKEADRLGLSQNGVVKAIRVTTYALIESGQAFNVNVKAQQQAARALAELAEPSEARGTRDPNNLNVGLGKFIVPLSSALPALPKRPDIKLDAYGEPIPEAAPTESAARRDDAVRRDAIAQIDRTQRVEDYTRSLDFLTVSQLRQAAALEKSLGNAERWQIILTLIAQKEGELAVQREAFTLAESVPARGRPENSFSDLSNTLFSSADALRTNPEQAKAFADTLAKARAESRLTDNELTILTATLGQLTTAVSDNASAWGEETFTTWNTKLTELVSGLDEGATSQGEFNDQAIDAIVQLERLAQAAEKAGYQDLADNYRAGAAGLRDLVTPAEDAADALGTLADQAGVETVKGLVELEGKLSDGAITFDQFAASALDAIPILETLAKAAEAAGRTDLAATYRQIIGDLKSQTAGTSSGLMALNKQLEELRKNLKEGSTDAGSALEESVKLAQSYDRQGRAAERAGNPELAAEYRKQAAALREQLGPLGKIVEVMGKVAGVAGIAKDALALMGQDDLSKAAGDIADGAQATIQAGTGVARVIANPADIGGWKDAILGTLKAVDSFGNAILDLDPKFKLWKKNLLEVAELEQKSMGAKMVGNFANPYFDALSEDISNRQKLAKATIWQRIGWSLFGGAPQVLSDEAAKLQSKAAEIFNSLGGALSSELETGLMNAFDSGDWSGAEKAFEKSLDTLIAKMALQLIIAGSKLPALIKKLTDDYANAISDGTISADEQAILNADTTAIKDERTNVSDNWKAIAPSLSGHGAGKAPEGSISDLDAQLQALQSEYNNARSDSERSSIKARIDSLTGRRDALTGSGASKLDPISSNTAQGATPSVNPAATATITQTIDLSPLNVLAASNATYIPMLAESGRNHLQASQIALQAAQMWMAAAQRPPTNWAQQNRQ